MMNELQMEQERSVLRWGGLAGILFIVVFVVVGAFQGVESSGPEGFPNIRASRTVENSLYLLVLVLWAIHFLALYRGLRGTSLAPSLFGSVLGIMGLAASPGDDSLPLRGPQTPHVRLLGELAEAGKVAPVIDRAYPLAEAPEAIRYMQDRHVRGKVVITV